MARIRPIPPERQTAEQKRVSELISAQRRAPVRGPFAVLLHAPEIAEPFANFVDLSLSEEASRIPIRLKELAIVTIARGFSADYEWFIHARRAAEYGVDPRAIEDIRRRRTPRHLNEDESLVYDVAREVVETKRLGDDAYRRAADRFGEEAMVELASLIGFYHAVSVVLNVFDVEAPEGDPRPLRV